MKKVLILTPLMALFLSGCTGGPSSSDVKNEYTKEYAKTDQMWGGRGPTIDSISYLKCEELKNDIIWTCNFGVKFKDGTTKDRTVKLKESESGWAFHGNSW